ncbi:N-acetylneuraminate lyase-like isoform X2 [Glandiceps talaboti]
MAKTVPCMKFKGLIAAPFTPFTKDGDINASILGTYVDRLCSDGVKSVYVNGTTGEGFSLSVEERKHVAEKWIEAGKDRLDGIIIQVGTGNLKTSQELAAHAEKIGADAIACIPSVPLKPRSVDEIVHYLAQISKVAPKTPLFYYHFDELTNVLFDMESLLDAIQDKVPTFHGMKFTSYNMYEFSRCLQHSNSKYQIFCSRDEALLSSLVLGGQAFVGSSHNFAGKLNNKILDAYKDGDMEKAKAVQIQQHQLISISRKYGGDAASMKAIMLLCGFDAGPTRPPFTPLSDQAVTALKKDLEDMGFFKLIE